MLESLQRVTDAALAYLPAGRAADRAARAHQRDPARRHGRDPAARAERRRCCAHAPPRASRRRSSRACAIPVGRGFAGRIAAERRRDHDRRRRPRRHPQPDPAREGHPLACSASRCSSRAASSASCTSAPSPRAASPPTTATCSSSPPTAPRSRSSTPSCYEQRRIAEALQRRLLPQELPAIAGLELAAATCRRAASSLGGDWYDVFELPGGRVALAVGDVVGHGVGAAAVMAQLRTALRAYAAEGHPPGAVVERVNRLMWSLGPTAMTTLAYGVLDPAEEELELVIAGHPPPLRRLRRRRRRTTCRCRAGWRSARRRRSTYRVADRPLPGRAARSCSTPTGSSSAAASRSTTGSSACARSASGSTTSKPVHTAARSAWSATSRRTTSPSSPPGSRR